MKTCWHESRITKDIISRKYFIKKELKLFILKSLIRNQNTKPILRAYSLFLLTSKTKKKWSIARQQNKCLLTGKAKSTLKISNISRQSTKKLIELGLMQNIKTIS